MEVAMNSIISKLRHFDEDELLILSEALDTEIARREERMEEHPDSARARARLRTQSYRTSLGTKAPPISTVGMKDAGRRRKFAA
jgi:hypothetical protein